MVGRVGPAETKREGERVPPGMAARERLNDSTALEKREGERWRGLRQVLQLAKEVRDALRGRQELPGKAIRESPERKRDRMRRGEM